MQLTKTEAIKKSFLIDMLRDLSDALLEQDDRPSKAEIKALQELVHELNEKYKVGFNWERFEKDLEDAF